MELTKPELKSVIDDTMIGLQNDTIDFKIGAYLPEDIEKMKRRLHRLWELVEAYHEMQD